MVAYNFMHQFANDVASGRKPFTIRADRKRHARPGETVQLYTGMRTRQCKKLVDPDPIYERVNSLLLVRDKEERCSMQLGGKVLTREQSDYIVATDGFQSHKDFMDFHLSNAASVNKVFIQWGFWNAK